MVARLGRTGHVMQQNCARHYVSRLGDRMGRVRRTVGISIGLILVGGIAYWAYGYATAEDRMKATCAAIKPGMSFAELKEFALSHGLLTPKRDSGVMYLGEGRSFGRHACKVLLEQGVVKQSEHNYAD